MDRNAGLAHVLRGQSLKHPHPFLAPVAPGGPRTWDLYAAMLAIWHLRPASQRRFPLQRGRIRDQIRFLAWCATDGRRDYRILREIPAWDDQLRGAIELPRLRGGLWEGSHSLMTLSGMIGSASARHRAARHFWRGARHRNHAPSVGSWQKSALHKSFGSTDALARTISMKKDASAPVLELVGKYGLADLDTPTPAAHAEDVPRATLPRNLARIPLPLPQPAARFFEPLLQVVRRGPTHGELVRVEMGSTEVKAS
jgi:hypothetical protein